MSDSFTFVGEYQTQASSASGIVYILTIIKRDFASSAAVLHLCRTHLYI